MKPGKHSVLIFFMLLCTTVCFFVSINCNTSEQHTSVPDGKSLSAVYCKNCHQYPEAKLLSQEVWVKHVLPAMAPRLGIQVYMEDQYVNNPSAKSAISYDNWLKIVDYYAKTSPKKLRPARVSEVPVKDWAGFHLIKPLYKVPLATTTMVAFDTAGKHIYTSDRLNSSIFCWTDQLKLQSAIKYASPAVNAEFSNNHQATFTFIGSMDAVDISNGFVRQFNLDSGYSKLIQIGDKLPRPVQSIPADLNNDKLQDWVVCGFGHNQGGLFWYEQLPGNQFKKHTISNMPGAEQAIAGDFDHDGWLDIACLFAQADEGIWLFLNDHKGGFKARNILRFPPMYGSSSFQLADFNNDGRLDIVYTSGDNSDYSKILKPYHGLYIFLNQGNFKFRQAYFYPVNGATKAIAADFNNDGKLDIALIAFFVDFKKNPAEGFTYFEQAAPLHFTIHNLPIEKEGRWICMNIGDYNQDGKPDIILGNFSMGFLNDNSVKPDWDTQTPFIILKNELTTYLKTK